MLYMDVQPLSRCTNSLWTRGTATRDVWHALCGHKPTGQMGAKLYSESILSGAVLHSVKIPQDGASGQRLVQQSRWLALADFARFDLNENLGGFCKVSSVNSKLLERRRTIVYPFVDEKQRNWRNALTCRTENNTGMEVALELNGAQDSMAWVNLLNV